MNCKETEIQLVAYRDGELDAAMKEAVAGHMTGCAACAKKLAALDRALAMFRGLGPDAAPADRAPPVGCG